MSESERNARLDELEKATDAWATKRTAELQHRLAIAKQVLKGRSGGERLASSSTQALASLIDKAFDEFLAT